MVDVAVGNKSVMRPFMYTVPLPRLGQISPLECVAVDEGDLGHSHVSSALRDAGFFTAGRALQVTIQLRRPGLVWSRPSGAAVLQPRTRTAHDLLMQFKSISEVLCFSFYLKHSQRLEEQLRVLSTGLRADVIKQWDMPLTRMQILDWSKLALDEPSPEPPQPPQYQTLVPASPCASVMRETCEDDRIPSPPPATGKRQRDPSSPTASNAKRTAKSDLTRLLLDEPSPESPQPQQYQILVPASPSSVSVIRETSCEDDRVPSPPPATGKCQRDLSSPAASNAKRTVKSELTRDLGLLMQVALPTLPPREFAQPHLQPYLDDFRTAIRVANADAFERAYGRFVALLLFDSIIPELVSDRGEDTTSADAAKITDRDTDNGVGEKEESETWESVSPLAREYLNDIFTVVTWVHSGDGFAVPVMWKSFCELGRAAREASDQGLSLQEASEGEYGEVKARILTLAIAGV